jgi:hypothetical protein
MLERKSIVSIGHDGASEPAAPAGTTAIRVTPGDRQEQKCGTHVSSPEEDVTALHQGGHHAHHYQWLSSH